ncbi:hypothetical protein M422DRAFT_196540, partial [Sphaerobolus stellatus SS14]
FFRHTDAASRNPFRFWQTVAGDLVNQYTALRADLSNAVKKLQKQQRRVEDLDIQSQFQELIKSPLEAYYSRISQSDINKEQVILLVVDALDEADRRDIGQWNGLLGTLAEAENMPPIFRLIITSRSYDDIRGHLELKCLQETLTTGEYVTEESQADIKRYLEYRFALISKRIQQQQSNISPTWPGKDIISQLSNQAAGLFIWAKVALDHIEAGGNPVKCLQSVQDSSSIGHLQGLDGLYMIILQSIYQNLDAEERDILQRVLWTIIMTKQPMDILSIEQLINAPTCSLWWVEQTLRPVLAEKRHDQLLRSCHKSFTDFMLDKERSGHFVVKQDTHGLFLVDSCLQLMNGKLKFNILRLTRGCFNRDIVNLPEKVSTFIPRSLQHACLYWAEYYPSGQFATNRDNLIQNLEQFLQQHFFHWLEVLSILSTRPGGYLLRMARQWLGSFNSDLHQFLTDGIRVTEFFCQSIQESCSGLYSTILTFAPRAIPLIKHYHKQYHHFLQIKGGMHRWPTRCHNVFLGHQGLVHSVAFSPDGNTIVSGSEDGTVRVWAAHTGKSLQEPLVGHQSWVTSVAYSPDGKNIASGSGDMSIRIWNMFTGQSLGKPLEGHQHYVTSVVFSPDGTKIVSGSFDKTIRVWDISNGQSPGLLLGHNSWVTSVAVSPDGTKIVSGSGDTTIRIWDISTGQTLRSLRGHDDCVTSVAFSPDGTKIISGSRDRTIQVWNTSTGQRLGQPLEGHGNWVTSVAFSPDMTKIVSGSYDKVILIWDASTYQNLGHPLKGHKDYVTSVAFSPDGMKIVSGSYDRTVQVWKIPDGRPSQQQKQSLQAHKNCITSVAYSPDGTKIVSGSADRIVRVWNASTGQRLGQPLKGHPSWVTSVAFSSDGTKIVSVSAGTTVLVWDISTGQSLTQSLECPQYYVTPVAYPPDQLKLACLGWRFMGHQSCLNSTAFPAYQSKASGLGGSLIQPYFLDHTQDYVRPIAYSPDGTMLVSSSKDMTVQIWNSTGQSLKKTLRGHSGLITSVAFSPDGTKIVSGSRDRTVQLWDVSTGQCLGQPLKGHQDRVYSIAFSPDGTKIISSSHDRTIQVWNVSTGQRLGKPLKGHQAGIYSVAFSPDGEKVVSGSFDNTIRVWSIRNMSTIQDEQPLEAHASSVNSISGVFLTNSIITVSDSDADSSAIAGKQSSTHDWILNTESGWILTIPDNTPVAWVPSILWSGLHTPLTQLVIGISQTVLDFNGYIPWEEWET